MFKFFVIWLSVLICFALPVAAKENNQQIKLRVKSVSSENNKLIAEIYGLTSHATSLGIGQMYMIGNAQIMKNGAMHQNMKITWNKARFKNTEINLGSYLKSVFALKTGTYIKNGDIISASATPEEIINLWYRIKNQALQNTRHSQRKLAENSTTLLPRVAAQNVVPNIAPAPAVPVAAEPVSDQIMENIDKKAVSNVSEDIPEIVETEDGCEVRIDKEQMVAIVQTRTLIGDSASNCSDSLTRYPLQKEYDSCPDFIDETAKTVKPQYKLYYKDPATDQKIYEGSCFTDDDKTIPISISSDACSLRHDFAINKSFKQIEEFYKSANNGDKIVIKECYDSDENYPHQETRIGCEIVNDQNKITYQARKYINIADEQIFISECAPEAGGQVPIFTKECESERFTHDFTTNQSFLNITSYYMNSGELVVVSDCQQSEESFTHKYDETVCESINDDENKQSYLQAKTYIEKADEKIYISKCQKKGEAFPYGVRNHWQVISTQENQAITPRNNGQKDYTQYFPTHVINGVHQVASYIYAAPFLGTDWQQTQTPDSAIFPSAGGGYLKINCEPKQANGQSRNWPRTCFTPIRDAYYDPQKAEMFYGANLTVRSTPYCFTGELQTPWQDEAGNVIDSVKSDASPQFNWLDISGCVINPRDPGVKICKPTSSSGAVFNYSCSQPICEKLTKLHKIKIYTRNDGSELIDDTEIQQITYVCGTGSKVLAENVQ